MSEPDNLPSFREAIQRFLSYDTSKQFHMIGDFFDNPPDSMSSDNGFLYIILFEILPLIADPDTPDQAVELLKAQSVSQDIAVVFVDRARRLSPNEGIDVAVIHSINNAQFEDVMAAIVKYETSRTSLQDISKELGISVGAVRSVRRFFQNLLIEHWSGSMAIADLSARLEEHNLQPEKINAIRKNMDSHSADMRETFIFRDIRHQVRTIHDIDNRVSKIEDSVGKMWKKIEELVGKLEPSSSGEHNPLAN